MSRWIEFHYDITNFIRDFMPVDFEAPSASSTTTNTTTEVEHSASTLFQETPLEFVEKQPDCFWEGEGRVPYRGQDGAKKRLHLYIETLREDERIKTLLVGPAGVGKTTLVRICAAKIRNRQRRLGIPQGAYYEILPKQLEDKANLDAFMMQIKDDPGAIVFIDEVHALRNLEAFYHVLHDTGVCKYPMSDGSWVDIPGTIHWLTATTDPGMLDAAMRRRLDLEVRLDTLEEDILADIIADAANEEGVNLHWVASWELAKRAGGFPWQALLLYREARKCAELEGAESVTALHAFEAFDSIGVDELGLLDEDRAVIQTLLKVNEGKGVTLATNPNIVRYKMSEDSLCAASGIDRWTYKKRIQPKLIKLGLLTVIGGQCLTDKALRLYGK